MLLFNTACVTVKSGLGKVTSVEDTLLLETGSKLERCLVDHDLIQSVDLNTEALADVELAALAETNSFAALGQSMSGGGFSGGLSPLFNYGYAGYSAEFRGVASLIEQDSFDEAAAYYARRSGSMITGEAYTLETAKKVGSLGLVTRGAIALDYGDLDCSTAFLTAAADIRSDIETGSLFEEFVGKATDYSLDGYERVLMLNQLALNYLLQSEPNAYPVTQQSRRYQDEQRELYAKEYEQIKAEAAKKQQEANNYNQNAMGDISNDEMLLRAKEIAGRVPSPYVNPLADYFSAVMAEIEATSPMARFGVWDEARIAWSKANKLYPDNPLIERALEHATFETNKPKDAVEKYTLSQSDLQSSDFFRGDPDAQVRPIMGEERIIHVLAAVGLSPERKVLMVRIPMEDNFIAIKIPYMSEVETKIAGVEVHINDKTYPLTLISDVEAMISRYHEDSMPLKIGAALASGFAGYYMSQELGGGGLFSMMFNEMTQQMTMPSTLGWMSLPKAYYAARIVAPRGVDQLQIDIIGEDGDVISSHQQTIIPDNSTMVYARAVNDKIRSVAQEKTFTLNLVNQ